jgi:hypothetical protein
MAVAASARECSRLCALVNAAQFMLVNCELWSEWIRTRYFGLRRQTAMCRACKPTSVVCRLCIDQPPTRRA